MNILFAADVPPDPDSGAAGTVYRTARALADLGHHVDTIWSDDLPRRVSHGNLHYLLELPWSLRRAVRDRMSEKRYDVVEISQPHGYLAAVHVRNREPVFIHRSHGLEMRREEKMAEWRGSRQPGGESTGRRLARRAMTRALRFNSRAIVRFADGHIVSCSGCARFLERGMGVPAARIAVVPQAAPDEYLAGAQALDSGRLRRVLHVGQFAPFKGPAFVAEVIDRLARAHGEISFTWVASERDHEAIRGLLRSEFRDRVELLGWMSQAALREVFDRHGVFLFPSLFEGFGKVFLEAMARGLCVVASETGGARDVIRDGVDGHLLPVGDVDGMEAACRRLIADPGRAERMSRQAIQTAREYSWKRVAVSSIEFYENRVQAKRRERAH